MSSIDILGIDELLIIFNLLCLFDKLSAMRVNKQWYSIIKKKAWKTINFYHRGPVKSKICRKFIIRKGEYAAMEAREEDDTDRGHTFPKTEEDVLKFLSMYAGVRLQEVHLPVVSVKIMRLLQTRCPNLQILSFFDDSVDATTGWQVDIGDDNKVCFPIGIKHLRLCVPNGYWWEWTRMSHDQQYAMYRKKLARAEILLSNLALCSSLQKLSLVQVDVSAVTMQHLIRNTSLEELELSNCSFYDPCTSSAGEDTTNMLFCGNLESCDSILTTSLSSFRSLTSLSLKFDHNFHLPNLSAFFRSVSTWVNLKKLVLFGIDCSEDTFQAILPGLLNLEVLELQCESVIKSVAIIIGTHLKALKVLKVQYEECRNIIKSLQMLANHPTLEELTICRLDTAWDTVATDRYLTFHCLYYFYDLLATLPNIRYVKLVGLRVNFYLASSKYPVLQSAVEIEVCDT